MEKSQNKPPSRIPIAIGRASSKDVGKDKISNNVIAAKGEKPLGKDSGIAKIYNNCTQSFWLSFKRQKFQPNWTALCINYAGTFNIFNICLNILIQPLKIYLVVLLIMKDTDFYRNPP